MRAVRQRDPTVADMVGLFRRSLPLLAARVIQARCGVLGDIGSDRPAHVVAVDSISDENKIGGLLSNRGVTTVDRKG
jgi:hypothetical protein